ncbi:3-oxoacyl-[acyl-carrier-protein] synthase 3 [Candidatus Rhabdochlamydia oedothoracis]|uniref:Beta-ketoacyl-[acyl-carrier-protein] synthase III n=1 Tax=Candidatus Rhabdochlamydia oedothoracis TaxID=2720720 RepID=A0ABX8V6E2_9BACT|nr:MULTISPECIES: beta-ketoacyl-ACP synthase III [Rhabdochlamydia]KAG6559047.1 3-oxoacyl-[acyl-carrier-protein] synthase 3 [Candidatus Rhabdochlamydia sp. W815]MCL6756694.1 ketoacyl-ACP synthase III [Candidatus Rhabdochlamydia oedothoracis]QYF48578.1 3-oxoacyl-[acyl-carrier-protein] synthase 3 [Candidatus Rhabdochlamydia oedothoracis]
MVQKARIISTGSYLPKKVLSNSDLEKMVDTSDEWIVSRTGMKERRLAATDEPTSEMGFQAAKKAIEKAGINVEEIELILFATLTPDYPFPSTACLIQARLGAFSAAAVDLQAACTGYIYALSQAKAYIESGMYRSILVVASEKLSSIVNYKDRATCVLFGDGAAACVVAKEGKGLFISDVCLGADGRLAELLMIPAGGSKKPASMETIQANQHYLQMEGKELFKHAVRRMEMAASRCLERASLKKEQIKWLIPHQANMRIIEAIAKRFDVLMEHVFLTLHKYGNTSASSIGIALDELLQEKDLRDEDHILLVAFGAGLTWGATILTYGAENA